MRTKQPYVQIDPDVLERIRQIDLLSYLREFEPSNLVKVKGTSNVYCTAEHDSLKISNGKWYWWSRGFGGYSALDYLIKVKEYDFVEAVEILTGQTMADWKPPPAPKKDEPKVLLLPPKNKDCNRVIQYLFGRGIDYHLIQECIADGTLYESADYHNAVFIGKDESGTPKYAALRSTLGSTFKQDASGSDKRYSFRLLAREPTDTVHLFEAAIDLLSYATYLKCEGKDYKSESLLSLSGVYQPKKEMKDSKIPIALTTFLSANPQIKTIVLHLDNDKVGRLYGQGQVLVNPLHMACIYSAFCNEGNVIKPYLVYQKDAVAEYWIPGAFSNETASRVLEGTKKVVNDSNGTGYAAHRDDILLAGKTGTAEIKASKDDTSGTELGWFAIFTAEDTVERPILIISMVEDVKGRGGSGYVVKKDNLVLEEWFGSN